MHTSRKKVEIKKKFRCHRGEKEKLIFLQLCVLLALNLLAYFNLTFLAVPLFCLYLKALSSEIRSSECEQARIRYHREESKKNNNNERFVASWRWEVWRRMCTRRKLKKITSNTVRSNKLTNFFLDSLTCSQVRGIAEVSREIISEF